MAMLEERGAQAAEAAQPPAGPASGPASRSCAPASPLGARAREGPADAEPFSSAAAARALADAEAEASASARAAAADENGALLRARYVEAKALAAEVRTAAAAGRRRGASRGAERARRCRWPAASSASRR